MTTCDTLPPIQKVSSIASPLETYQGKRIVLIAGSGELPARVVESAQRHQLDLRVYTLDRANLGALKKMLGPAVRYIKHPGRLNQTFDWLHQDGATSVVFAGKVSKSMLLRSLVLDSRGRSWVQKQMKFNDDSIMWSLISELHGEGIEVLPQVDFLREYFVPVGCYTHRPPTDDEEQDLAFGFSLAKEMGRLDVGQTVVVSNGMVLAIEAIEGTDEAIRRTRKWAAKRGGVVCKVEKPNQDRRFDVPTVGVKTLRSMKHAGLKVLAVEAGKTFVVDKEKVIDTANRWGMTLVAR